MVPFERSVSPDGNGGLTSHVSISGPSLVAGMRMLSLALNANSVPIHEMASGGRLVTLIWMRVEVVPPELLAQIRWYVHGCKRVADPLIAPVVKLNENPNGGVGSISQ